MTPRVSGTESISSVPLEAYVAATSISTLSLKPLTDAQFDFVVENVKPDRTWRSAAGRS